MVQSLSFLKSGVQVGVGANAVSLSATSSGLQFVDAQSNTTLITPGDAVGGGGATIVANNASLPLVGLTAGQFAFSTANSQLFISNGSGWYKIALINETPTITLSTESIVLPSETFVDVTYTVVEPEGTPVTVTVSNSAIANTSLAKVVHFSSNNTIRVFANTTGFSGATITVSASDGVNIGVDSTTFQVTALVESSDLTRLLVTSEATVNGSDNKIFDDESDNNHTITAVGDTALTGKTPYAPAGFSTTGVYTISGGGAAQPQGLGDYTVEFWLYLMGVGNTSTYYGNGNIYINHGNVGYDNAALYFGTSTNGGTGTGIALAPGGNASASPYLRTWVHVALVRESGTFKFYWNGVKVANELTASVNHTGTTQTRTDTTSLVSDLRVSNTAVYTTDFTPPTVPLTADANTLLLTFNDKNVYDSSGTIDATLIASNEMVAFGPYEHTGWSVNSGGSAIFDGTGDKLTVPSDTSLELGTGDYTVEFWVWKDNTSDSAFVASVSNGGMDISYNTGAIRIGRVNTAWDTIFSGSALADYQWNHVAIARNASIGAGSTTLWINGHLIETVTNTNTYNFLTLQLGFAGTTDGPLNGYLSDVRIVKGTAVYDSSAGDFTPPTEPLSKISGTSFLMSGKGASILDKTGQYGIKLATGITASTEQTKYGSTSIKFASGSGSISYDLQDGNDWGSKGGAYTIEFWIYFNDVTTTAQIWGDEATNRLGQMDVSSGTIRFLWSGTPYITSSTVSTGQWYHVALVRQQGATTNIKMYLDGTQTGSTDTTSSQNNAEGPFYIGSANLQAYIEDFRYTNEERYTTTFTPPTAKLAG